MLRVGGGAGVVKGGGCTLDKKIVYAWFQANTRNCVCECVCVCVCPLLKH